VQRLAHPDGRLAVGGLADDFKSFLLTERFEALPKHDVIVRDEDPQCGVGTSGSYISRLQERDKKEKKFGRRHLVVRFLRRSRGTSLDLGSAATNFPRRLHSVRQRFRITAAEQSGRSVL
jgi:hypothetical protein